MAELQHIRVKRCLTASGWLLERKKVLLIKHKMLKTWMSPGGHVEPNELPHQAAEREFLEETGMKVRAISAYPMLPSTESEFLPLPFSCNLHWINKPGEPAKPRTNGDICEQHYVFQYFVARDGNEPLVKQVEEVDDISWFTESEIDALPMLKDVNSEAHSVFQHFSNSSGQ